ncbi:hypothetical protein, partial [Hydrogenobacter sp. Uz 6-8]
PQVDRPFRLDADMLEDYYIETPAGERVPISSVVTMTESVEPGSRNQHQQLNSLTLEGVMTPGTPLGDALEYLETTAEDTLPSTY